jgi:hypothetical protein
MDAFLEMVEKWEGSLGPNAVNAAAVDFVAQRGFEALFAFAPYSGRTETTLPRTPYEKAGEGIYVKFGGRDILVTYDAVRMRMAKMTDAGVAEEFRRKIVSDLDSFDSVYLCLLASEWTSRFPNPMGRWGGGWKSWARYNDRMIRHFIANPKSRCNCGERPLSYCKYHLGWS